MNVTETGRRASIIDVELEKEDPTESQENLIKSQYDRILGIFLLVLGISMLLVAGIMASGAFGGSMYFVAGALTITSLIPLILAAYYLSREPEEMRGSQRLLDEDNETLDSKFYVKHKPKIIPATESSVPPTDNEVSPATKSSVPPTDSAATVESPGSAPPDKGSVAIPRPRTQSDKQKYETMGLASDF